MTQKYNNQIYNLWLCFTFWGIESILIAISEINYAIK